MSALRLMMTCLLIGSPLGLSGCQSGGAPEGGAPQTSESSVSSDGWTEFMTNEEGFTAKFPSKPSKKQGQYIKVGGKLPTEYEAKLGDIFYVVRCWEISLDQEADADTLFKEATKGYEEYKPKTERVEFGHHDGLMLEVEQKDLKSRGYGMYVVGHGKFFGLTVYGKAADADNFHQKKFFDSFRMMH